MKLFKAYSNNFTKLGLSLMLEQFCFYGVGALLVMQMHALAFTEDQISFLTDYKGLSYQIMVIGGLAGFFLYNFNIGLWALLIYFVGSILTAISSFSLNREFMYAGLIFIILGRVLFKPWIYARLSNSFDINNSHRMPDAFLFFLWFINLGAFFAPLAIGTVGFGVHLGAGFVTAGLAALGATVILRGQTITGLKETSKKLKEYKKFLIPMLILLYAVQFLDSDPKISSGTSSLLVAIVDLLPEFVAGISAPFLWIFISKKGSEMTRGLVCSLLFLMASALMVHFLQAYESVLIESFVRAIFYAFIFIVEFATLAILLSSVSFRWGILLSGAFFSLLSSASYIKQHFVN